ncbi:MAG: response regulator [Nitrospirota bacterium]|nr:MAG: response regulator [Nitrospirota bacterium]
MSLKHKILVVGDNIPIRSDYLSTQGYIVITASDGAEALQQIEAEHLDLILIDDALPDTSGNKLCRHIRKLSDTNLPAIMLIAESSSRSTPMKEMEIGVDDILCKPVQRSQILLRIRSLLKIRASVRGIQEQAAQLKKRNVALENQLNQKFLLADAPKIMKDLGGYLKKQGAHIFNLAFVLKSDLENSQGTESEVHEGLSQDRAEGNLAKESLRMLKQSALEIQDTAKAMTDFAKAFIMPTQFKSCQLAEMTSSLLTRLHPNADDKRIQLRAKGLYGLPVIQADEERLAEALYYLVRKAISQMSAGGSLTLRGEVLPEGKVVRLILEGSGGDPSIDLFEDFAHASFINQPSDVAGLWSMIPTHCVERHGGSIKVTTKQRDTIARAGRSQFEVARPSYSTVSICLPTIPTKFSPVCDHCPKEVRGNCFTNDNGKGGEFPSHLPLVLPPARKE